jgi:hypothetical protein
MKEERRNMAHLSRRDFIKAVLASSALYAVGSSSSGWDVSAEGAGPISPGSGPFDVAIIGAGSAGIGAAQILKQARKKFVVLEARDRIGGRTFTDTTSFPGIAWDLGAQWFHQVTPKIGGRPDQTNTYQASGVKRANGCTTRSGVGIRETNGEAAGPSAGS